MLAQGKDVHIGEFGNEGSGGQSYLKYPWKAGQTYRVVTVFIRTVKGNTAYYLDFFAPEEGEWRLIGRFSAAADKRMVHRSTFFPLKTFMLGQGYLERSVHFGNQWARTAKEVEKELIEGMFTYDATARARCPAGIMPVGWKIICSSSVTAVSSMIIQSSNLFLRQSNGTAPDVDVTTLPLK